MADQQNTQNKSDANPTTGTTGKGGVQNTGSGGGSSFGSGQSGQGVKGAQETQKGSGAGGDTADKVASAVGDALRGDTSTVTEGAKNIAAQVKESGGKLAGEAIGQVKEKATGKIEEQKTNLAQGLDSVAQTIRQVGDTLKGTETPAGVASTTAEYSDKLARQVEQFSDYLERHNVSELMRDVESFARRNPAYFIGGAFLLGFLGARFLKSSTTRGGNSGNGGHEEIFHGQPKTKISSEGLPITTSGEGVRPL